MQFLVSGKVWQVYNIKKTEPSDKTNVSNEKNIQKLIVINSQSTDFLTNTNIFLFGRLNCPIRKQG